MSQIRVRNLEAHEIPRASQVMVDAFFNDPFWTFIFPDEARRRRQGPRLAASLIRCARLFGRAWTTPGVEGVALRRLPGDYDISFWQLLRSGMILMPAVIGFRAFLRVQKLVGEMDRRHGEKPLAPHWHAWILAVDPKKQGQGFGAALMAHTFRETEGAALYLETLTERNVAIHGKHGYRVLTDRPIPGANGLNLWTMWREGPK